MTGVVLAGGRSRRMGADKAMLDWQGQPLIDHVAARLATLCQPVLIASGDGQHLGRANEIADALADVGPLGGLLAALQHSTTPLLAVVAVDMPDASPAVLHALAEHIGDYDAVIPLVHGRLQPLHAIYRTRCASQLRDYLAQGGRSVQGFIATLNTLTADETIWAKAEPSGTFARNLNTPEDL